MKIVFGFCFIFLLGFQQTLQTKKIEIVYRNEATGYRGMAIEIGNIYQSGHSSKAKTPPRVSPSLRASASEKILIERRKFKTKNYLQG